MLILGRFFPRELNGFVLSRFYGIELRVEREKSVKDVDVCKFKYGSKAAFYISMDFEIATRKQLERGMISQQAVYELLKIARSYSIPVTWAVSGKILTTPSGYRQSFNQIVASETGWELASHTFSHIDFSACSRQTAEKEISSSFGVLDKYMHPRSLVFPYRREGHHNLLAESGFIAYRGATNVLGYPEKIFNMWHIYPTYYFNSRSSNFAAFTLRVLLFALVDIAIKYGCSLHLWSHPWEMDVQKDAGRFIEKVLHPLFSYVASKREKGEIWPCTMREFANYCEARQNCIISDDLIGDKEINVKALCQIEDSRFDHPPSVTLRFKLPKSMQRESLKTLVDDSSVVLNGSASRHLETLEVDLAFNNPVKNIRIETA